MGLGISAETGREIICREHELDIISGMLEDAAWPRMITFREGLEMIFGTPYLL